MPMMPWRYLLAFSIAAFLHAQLASTAASITGRVLDSVTGAPLENVQVTDSADASAPVRTDADGRFLLPNLRPGVHTVAVTGKSDYAVLQRNFRLGPGQQLKDVELRADKGGVISGIVIDQEKNAVSGAMVTALAFAKRDGGEILTSSHSARTNAKGEFSILKLQPREYIVVVETPHLEIAPLDEKPKKIGVVRPVRTFYARTNWRDTATKVLIGAGHPKEVITIELLSEETVCISANMPAIDGNVVVSLAEAYPSSQSHVASGLITKPGNLGVCGIPKGDYLFTVVKANPG